MQSFRILNCSPQVEVKLEAEEEEGGGELGPGKRKRKLPSRYITEEDSHITNSVGTTARTYRILLLISCYLTLPVFQSCIPFQTDPLAPQGSPKHARFSPPSRLAAPPLKHTLLKASPTPLKSSPLKSRLVQASPLAPRSPNTSHLPPRCSALNIKCSALHCSVYCFQGCQAVSLPGVSPPTQGEVFSLQNVNR